MSDAAAAGATLPEDSSPGTGWGSTLVRLLVAVLVLGAAYVAVAVYFKDRPPAGLTVAGVDIGGLTREEAETELRSELSGRTGEALHVTVLPEGAAEGEEPQDLELVPEEAGLGLDLDATLDGVTGLSLDPRVLWAHVAGTGRELPLVGSVDRPVLEGAVTGLAEDYDQEPVEGEVDITEEEGLQVVDPVPGRELDVLATVEAVATAWSEQVWDAQEPAPRERAVDGQAVVAPPLLTAEEVERFRTEELDPALSAPVLVTAGRGEGEDEQTATAELGVRDLRALLDVEVSPEQTLALSVDEEALVSRVRQDLGQLETGPRDATVRLAGGEVEVVPARVGHALETDDLADAVRAALTATGEGRAVEAEIVTVEPEIPTEASKDWSFSPMATFSSAFPTYAGNEARTANLRAGVANVNGTVVMPGEQFSLSAALGEISAANGYVDAPIIVDGRLVKGMGGGLSQISTVVFNTSWFAGVQLDAHTPHSYYIPRYPAGREATLAVPVIDNLWTNDTDTPVVVQSWVEGDTIHMTYLGERQYDVQTVDGERWNYTTGSEHQDDSPQCVPQNAEDGFTITNVRILTSGGTEVGRDEFTTTYQPSDQVICTNPAAGRR